VAQARMDGFLTSRNEMSVTGKDVCMSETGNLADAAAKGFSFTRGISCRLRMDCIAFMASGYAQAVSG